MDDAPIVQYARPLQIGRGTSESPIRKQESPSNHQSQIAIPDAQTSSSCASSARSMMKRKRADASLPISSLMTRSVTMWSAISTRSSRRVRGFSVVSHSTLGIISPSPLNRVISGRRAIAVVLQEPVAVGIVKRPERLLADVDAIERRLREEHAAGGDELRQMAVDEREQQRRDVMAVGVGVGKDDDLAVAQPRQVEVLAHPAAERRDQVGELLVLEHLGERHPLGVHHLAAQRKDGLPGAIAALLGGAAGRIAFDDEKLALVAIGAGAVAEFPGRFSRPVVAVLRVTSACAARLASRARAARMMRATIASAIVRL